MTHCKGNSFNVSVCVFMRKREDLKMLVIFIQIGRMIQPNNHYLQQERLRLRIIQCRLITTNQLKTQSYTLNTL